LRNQAPEVRRAAEAKWGKILAEPTTNGNGAASGEPVGAASGVRDAVGKTYGQKEKH